MTAGRAVSWNAVLRKAARDLTDAGVDDPMRDARRLLAHCLGIAAERVTLFSSENASESEVKRFEALIRRRVAREPVSHIIGSREFYGRQFRVTQDVLDPRPETEHLVEVALEQPFERVLDLGVGSGCILLTLLAERPHSSGVGSDISEAALGMAQKNAVSLGVAKRCEFCRSDWFEEIRNQFDLIVSNPPYIAQTEMAGLSPEVRNHEPQFALTPGGDGLDAYRVITAGVVGHLSQRGRLIVEIGPTQAADVKEMFKASGLQEIRVVQDLDGRDRVVIGNNPR